MSREALKSKELSPQSIRERDPRASSSRRSVAWTAHERGAPGVPLTIFAITTLYGLDAMVLGQGFVALAMVLAVVFGLLPKIWLSRRVGHATRSSWCLTVALSLCAVAIMFTISLNNRLAESRGASLAGTIEQYRALAGHYPAALSDLVPNYLASVPRAKYTLTFGRFDYRLDADGPALAFTDAPPFGRSVYDFDRRRWR